MAFMRYLIGETKTLYVIFDDNSSNRGETNCEKEAEKIFAKVKQEEQRLRDLAKAKSTEKMAS